MDLTPVFRSRLDIVRNRSKALGTSFPDGSPGSGVTGTGPKSRIFPGKKSEYYTRARELCSIVTNLRDSLVDNRSAYLSFGSGPLTKTSKTQTADELTDAERDKIDADVQKTIISCQKKIFEFERHLETNDIARTCPQLHTHLQNVHNSLASYLKEVCAIHSEMRAVRVKRTIEYQTMSRLAARQSHPPISRPIKSQKLALDDNLEDQSDGDVGKPAAASHPYFDEELSPEELQVFEAENQQLLNELNNMREEVDQIEASVVKIADLQDFFTSNVLEQEKIVQSIQNNVVGATENIRGGNEQIRQAIQRNADFRAWILFFLIVMSFSLIFLDWYND